MSEVADIFSKYGKEYRGKHKLSNQMMKVMKAIEDCRTAKLGGHIDECDECGNIRISYNSCRNRHCPKCQSLAKERWLTDRKNVGVPIEPIKEKKGWQELLLDLTGKDPMVCPCCKIGRFIRKEFFGPLRSENVEIKKTHCIETRDKSALF